MSLTGIVLGAVEEVDGEREKQRVSGKGNGYDTKTNTGWRKGGKQSQGIYIKKGKWKMRAG